MGMALDWKFSLNIYTTGRTASSRFRPYFGEMSQFLGMTLRQTEQVHDCMGYEMSTGTAYFISGCGKKSRVLW